MICLWERVPVLVFFPAMSPCPVGSSPRRCGASPPAEAPPIGGDMATCPAFGVPRWTLDGSFNGDFMVILWWFYGDFMVVLWWFYGDILVINGDLMVINPLAMEYEWLVGGDWNHGILWLSICWEFHHPNWRTHIFQRGSLPPTSNS